MRKLILIVGCILAVISFDLVMGAVSRLLRTQARAIIGDWGMTASWTVIPAAFVFTPPKRNATRNWPLRLSLATLTSWHATLVFRMQFNLPATRELARERGDLMYDGVGMNAALLVTGWIPPLIVTAVLIAVYSIFTRHSGVTDDGVVHAETADEATEP
ncbi:hypothetical protein CEE69_30405 [Rhodopirellula bahusiensis]|uniref:Uncharacterized protein n=2 Tax=Rhodopirellula bahusiensis TaxID=2014065 RepID=A0A2G1VXV0_9BACT|nr:hypothetical protein CEE69_30405 [Rhodopirellula bahusiensis]